MGGCGWKWVDVGGIRVDKGGNWVDFRVDFRVELSGLWVEFGPDWLCWPAGSNANLSLTIT